MNPNPHFDPRDLDALHRSAQLLEATGRGSPDSTVALNCLAAAHLLAQAGIAGTPPATWQSTDGEALGEVLDLFGGMANETLQLDPVLDALHHVLVARLEAS